MITIFENSPKSRNLKKFIRKTHFVCARVFSLIEKNEKNLALITGLLILISAFGGTIKSIVVLLREFGFTQFDSLYKFVESHLVIFEVSILLLKLVTVLFVLVFLGKYGLAKVVDSTKEMLVNIYQNYGKIRASVNNASLDDLYANISPVSFSEDLDTITNMGYQAFGEENVTKAQRRELFEEWYKGNNDVFSLILEQKSKEVIGYVCILPLTQSIGHHNFHGNISQFKIQKEDISNKVPAKYVCWQAVYLKDEYQDNIMYISALTRLMFLKTRKFINEKDSIIYAESFSDHGTKILKRFGFEETSLTSIQKHKIFAIKLSDGKNLNAFARNSLELIKNL